MDFLSPLFWIGAAAVVGPILLHLVQKEKRKRIPFASLMLMPRVPIKQMRRRRLQHLFLLALRCLGILLLAAAFARPVVTSAWFDRINPLTARSLVLLIDNSLSMSRPQVWPKAIEEAEEAIGSLGDSDEGKIVLFGESGAVVSQWESRSEQLVEVLRSQVSPSYEATSYLEGLRLAAEQFQGDRNARKEIRLITDLQRVGLTSTQGWKIPTDVVFQLRDVGAETSNLFIEEVRLERDVFGKRYPFSILARVASSPAAAVDGTAQLFVEGKLVDRQSFKIGEEGSGQVTFKPFELAEGASRGKIVLEPADDLPVDNVHYFVVERKEPSEALIVGRKTSSFYLQNALATGENLPFAVRTAAAWPDQLSPQTTPLAVLDDLRRLPNLEQVKKYVEGGGGLIVALAGETQESAYTEEWGQFLPAWPLERKYVRSGSKPFTSITQASWDHPVFNIFQDLQKSAVASAQFYGYWRLALNPQAAVLARFDEGAPALVEGAAGAGKIIVFSSSLDSAWTDFPVRSAYLPLWFRVAEYVAGWESAPAAYRINQAIPAGAEDGWDVLDPTGKRVLGLDERLPGALQLKLPGHYEIRENKGTDWVAANVAPIESIMDRIPAQDLEAVFVPAQSRSEAADGEEPVSAREKQQSLWWAFLIAAGLVLSLESIIANRVTLREQTS